MKNIVFGILAHVDSGKTTLSEGMLYECKSIRKLGRVDHGDTALDTNEIEKNRGITVFSKQAKLTYRDTCAYLIDTPGHVDFSAEMERTLSVLDYAILVISGTDGIQNHTETLWQLLERYSIPTFIFVNKMDLAGADKDKVLSQLQTTFSSYCTDFTTLTDDVMENIALADESLMEKLLCSEEITTEDLSALVAQRKLFPCIFGSALKSEGVVEMLELLDKYTVQQAYPNDFGAKVYKISHDEQGNRLTYLKITGGSLKPKDTVKQKTADGETVAEKVNQIRVYTGEKFTAEQIAESGTVCAVTGLTATWSGQGLGIDTNLDQALTQPIFTYKVILDEKTDAFTALAKFRILEQEDPQLNVTWKEHLNEIHISLMGEIQLEVLKTMCMQRFGMAIEFSQGNVLYKETIKDLVEGVGHFEPLRHYSEVHLLLEPLKQGQGLVFDSLCSEDKLDKNWQRLVLTHLAEKTHLGVLTGSPITDMKITLVSGRAHIKHTEGGDFRQATYRAVRHGLMQAENVLLEPWYNFTITVPMENIGRVMADVQKMSGSFAPPETVGENAVLKGTAPVVKINDYKSDIVNFTRGKGRINCQLKGYFPCHNASEVIEKFAYDPEADLENTPDSVFCTHGAAIVVKWYDVKNTMHLESFLKPKRESVRQSVTRSQVTEYRSILEQDKELLKIFEATYGKIKVDSRTVFDPAKNADKQDKMPKARQYDKDFLLVDGYNIIFAWDDLKAIAKDDINAARERLINILCNYQGFKKCEVILVFDAYKVKGNVGSIERYHNITIVYTKEAETADMYIEKVTHQIAKNHRVRVATSDGLEQIIILGHGAMRLSATNFRAEVDEIEKAIREIIE
ncbi:MAG: TetM/TetW/TetO/TetS family tetracycline resistance ribosomal protection protein [Oscillospiraceae bacterium]|nr:TetM/TetW/TetO/TetS family tetracycline resistance ribosomal protection protein [Oscillospiraceae bacterium]